MIRRKNARSHVSTEPLAAWIRQHPDAWDVDFAPLDPQRLDRLTETVLERARQLPELDTQSLRNRRRRRWIVGMSLTVALVAGGTVGVAALFRGGQPSKPELGVLCQDRLGEGRNMIVRSE